MTLWTVLAPMIFVAAGGCIALASEPFIRDERKHTVLPWITVAAFVAAIIAACMGSHHEVILNGMFATDTVRTWLVVTIAGAGIAGVAGLQHVLGRAQYAGGEPYALLSFAAIGAMGMVLATDFIALLVSLELASLAIYGAIGLRRDKPEAGEGLFKYLIMGAVFSSIFLYGIALTYGATGSTQFGAEVIPQRESLANLGLIFLLIGLLFKVGAVPFHFWSPDAYTGASVPVTGFMASVMKIGGFAALANVWLHFWYRDRSYPCMNHSPLLLSNQGCRQLRSFLVCWLC